MVDQTKTLTLDQFNNLQGMADCMDMVRQEFIQSGLIDESIPPMFVVNAVLNKFAAINEDAKRFAACRHQARHMQEDGGEAGFIKAIDEYRKKNNI